MSVHNNHAGVTAPPADSLMIFSNFSRKQQANLHFADMTVSKEWSMLS